MKKIAVDEFYYDIKLKIIAIILTQRFLLKY